MKRNLLALTILLFAYTLLSAQNVGIGTTAPTAILHTKGTVRHEQLATGNGNFLVVDSLGNVFKSPLSTLSTLSRTEILVKYTWEVDEIYSVVSGGTKHYKRGVENTTGSNYDISRYTFKADGTSVYTDVSGVIHQATWRYTSVDQNNIEFSFSPATYNWSMISVSEAEFLITTPLPTTVVSSRLIPVL